MRKLSTAVVALALSAFAASCFSGSSSSGTAERKPAAKRLGGSTAKAESAPAPKSETPASSATTPAASAASSENPAGQNALRTLYVNVTSANVRSMPTKDATIVAKLKYLDTVGATGMLDGEWVQVEVKMSDGNMGKAWIHSTLVSASKEQAEAVKAAAGGK